MKRLGIALTAAGFLVLLLLFVRQPGTDYPTLSPWFFLANVSGVTLVLFARLTTSGLRATLANPGVCFLLTAVGAACIFILSASLNSSNIAELNVCSSLLWPAALVVSERRSSSEAAAPLCPPNSLSLCLALAFAAFSISHAWTWTYDDEPFTHLHSSLLDPHLRGILTTESRAAQVDPLIKAIQQRTRPGDRLLSYQWFPGLYWLTSTRPFLYSAVVANDLPPDPLMSRWVNSAVRSGRAPNILVTGEPISGRNSLEQFIIHNYQEEETIGTYTLWKRRQSEKRVR